MIASEPGMTCSRHDRHDPVIEAPPESSLPPFLTSQVAGRTVLPHASGIPVVATAGMKREAGAFYYDRVAFEKTIPALPPQR